VTAGEGNKLIVNFDHSGEKKVIDTFVTRGWRISAFFYHRALVLWT
jgi:hypothetical protein